MNKMLIHVTELEHVGSYLLKLSFNNGVVGIIDLEPELYGEIFEPLRNEELFRRVFLTSRTIEWPNGADFAPEFLLEQVMQAGQHNPTSSIEKVLNPVTA